MIKCKKINLVIGIGIIMLSFWFDNLMAQQYNRSAGIRFGGTSGITYKKFIVEEEALELILSGRNNGIQLTTLYIFHQPMQISFNESFYFYYGVGGHLGMEKFNEYHKILFNDDPDNFFFSEKEYFTVGIDAMAGIEYRLFSVPVTLSLDIKPYVNYIGLRYLKADFWDASIAIKYIF